MARIKVMVVDDSAVVRQVVTGLLEQDPDIEVIAACADPILAIERLRLQWPDVFVQRELIAGTLESLGVHQITQAASGDLALQKLTAAHGFNLLLLDLHMPGIDGFQFMEALVNTHYAGALIIVSGQSDEVMHAASMVAKLRRFNVLGSVPKPVGRAALSALLDKIMQ